MKTATPLRSPINDNTLERIRKRLSTWRKSKRPRSRIPDALWAAAVEEAARCGVNRVAKTLGLDYYSLKKRLDASGDSAPVFMELLPAAAGSVSECSIELEGCDGTKMRIQIKGAETPDVAALSRGLWGISR
jgi:ribosomal protein L32